MSAPTIPVSSPELYAAYVAWRDQDGDLTSVEAYYKRAFSLRNWVEMFEGTGLQIELDKQLHASKPVYFLYPFGGSGEYLERSITRTQHLNPARIKWVNDRIADYENSLKGETP